MHFGLQIPYAIPAARDDLLTWMRRAESGPFRTLSIGERVTFDNPDQIVALAAAAAATDRVRLLANISVLPIHPTALAAKAFATIDRMSEGRLVVTPGVGSRPEDFAAAGTTYTNRWQRVDDAVFAMKRMWEGNAAEPSGSLLGPPPYTEGGPVLHCSATGPKALARAVQWASGYQGFTTDGSLEALSSVARRVASAFEEAGRPRPELGVSCFFALGDGSLARLREVVDRYYGFADAELRQATVSSLTIASREAIVETLAHAEAAGFDEVHFLPTTVDPTEIDRLERVLGDCPS
jgi:alkanesulfonate monooxygenase SsuD/methylene tetrahydromethanopterin reductase-like flavin-dependent oxidoreductase (luciferase family)